MTIRCETDVDLWDWADEDLRTDSHVIRDSIIRQTSYLLRLTASCNPVRTSSKR